MSIHIKTSHHMNEATTIEVERLDENYTVALGEKDEYSGTVLFGSRERLLALANAIAVHFQDEDVVAQEREAARHLDEIAR